MDSQTSALIIARSGQLRESLLVLLRAIPQIERIDQADDALSAVSLRPEVHPNLVLCDFDLPLDEALTMLNLIKARWPQSRCVALVEDERARQAAAVVGIDVVLTKGVLAARLLETIEGLLAKEACGQGAEPAPRQSAM